MRARWAAWWPRTAEWPRPNRKATWNARSDEWWLTARRRTTPSVRFTTGVIRAPETGRKHVTLAQGHHDQDARVDPRTGPPPSDRDRSNPLRDRGPRHPPPGLRAHP